MKEEKDRLLDSVLLVYLLKEAGEIYGRTKVQKTIFLAELSLREKGLTGPHFSFYRHLNGPFSGQLWNTFDELATGGFLFKTTFKPTERGFFLIDLVIPELRKSKKNEKVFHVLDSVLSRYRKWPGRELMEYVYDLEVVPDDLPNKRMKVEDIPLGIEIITPPPGGLIYSSDLITLIKEELEISNEELEQARQDFPNTERRILKRLSKALSVGQPA